MIRTIPVAAMLHCIMSMWAYGSTTVFAKGVETRISENGETTYYAADRSFSERLFNKNSLPFFILLIIFIVVYASDLIFERYFLKKFFQINEMIDLKQKRYSEIKDTMKEFSEVIFF